MRPASFAFFVFLCSIALAARAEEAAWTAGSQPAFADHVVSFEIPAGWQQENSINDRAFRFRKGEKFISFPHAQLYLRKLVKNDQKNVVGEVLIVMQTHDLPKPVDLDRWVEAEVAGWKSLAQIVYEKGYGELLRKRAFYYLVSRETAWVDGKEVKATAPNSKVQIAVLNDRILVELTYIAEPTALFEEYAPVFERFQESIKITPVSALDASQISQLYKSPEIRISQRRDYYLETTFSMELPPGWGADAIAVEPATAKRQRGQLVVEAGPDGMSEDFAFLVVIQGMPVTALSRDDYLATADQIVAAVIPEHGPGQAAETTSLPDPFFCQARRKLRHGEGTGRTYARTYTGKDPEGRPLKARVYTAGGMTMVCNLIYIDNPAAFDSSLPLIEGIVGSVKSSEYSPSFRR